MELNLKDKTVVIIGASGGLGSGFAKAFADKGARLLLAGRNEEKLRNAAAQIKGDITMTSVDVTKEESIIRFSEFAKEWSGKIDIIVNASGHDVRKSLEDHAFEEIHNALDVNLLGTILVTKAFLPIMKDNEHSMIVHIGGFADGRLAFPYYSVDAASRAGMFTFIEATNRELELEGSKSKVGYFCPSPAETDAERPFHPLWREMGIKILSVENVSEALLKAIEKRKSVSIMGGAATVFFAKLNSIMPGLADGLMMKTYGKMLKAFLYGKADDSNQEPKRKNSSLLNKIAVILVVLSFVLYGLIFVVPFLPLTIAQKAMIVPVLVAAGEATWWIGVAIVGKQVVTKYRKYLNPCNWFSCRKNNFQKSES